VQKLGCSLHWPSSRAWCFISSNSQWSCLCPVVGCPCMGNSFYNWPAIFFMTACLHTTGRAYLKNERTCVRVNICLWFCSPYLVLLSNTFFILFPPWIDKIKYIMFSPFCTTWYLSIASFHHWAGPSRHLQPLLFWPVIWSWVRVYVLQLLFVLLLLLFKFFLFIGCITVIICKYNCQFPHFTKFNDKIQSINFIFLLQ